MVKYIVTGPKVSFGAGFVLGLTAEQARNRAHLIKKDGKYYRVLEEVQFKKDEVIDIITQNLTKATLKNLELLNKPATPAKPPQKKKEEDPPAEVPEAEDETPEQEDEKLEIESEDDETPNNDPETDVENEEKSLNV